MIIILWRKSRVWRLVSFGFFIYFVFLVMFSLCPFLVHLRGYQIRFLQMEMFVHYKTNQLDLLLLFFLSCCRLYRVLYPSIWTTILGSLDKRARCNVCLEAERNFTRKMTGKFTLNFKEKPYMNTVNMSLYGQGRVTLCFIKYKKGDIYRTSLNQCNGHKLVLT